MKIKNLVENYISYNRAIGKKFNSIEYFLKAFVAYLRINLDIKRISAKKILGFLYKNVPITSTWFVKYSALSGFYEYAISRGFVTSSPLPVNLPKRPNAFIPYIYTRKELQRLFKAALTYQKKPSCIEPYMISKFLLILYATGLRLSEALSLTMEDVNISQSVITVKQTKFYKSRLVPFGDQLKAEIVKYLKWRKKQKFIYRDNLFFFYGQENKPLNMITVQCAFKRIRKIAGVQRTDSAKYQPRLHDLRHTFAVHRLTSWYQENADVQQLLPVLSVYMGHACISATSTYLKMTNELLQEAGKKFEKYVNGEF